MKNQVETPPTKPAEASDSNAIEFNFDSWVKQVRPQLLASLHRRGARY